MMTLISCQFGGGCLGGIIGLVFLRCLFCVELANLHYGGFFVIYLYFLYQFLQEMLHSLKNTIRFRFIVKIMRVHYIIACVF